MYVWISFKTIKLCFINFGTHFQSKVIIKLAKHLDFDRKVFVKSFLNIRSASNSNWMTRLKLKRVKIRSKIWLQVSNVIKLFTSCVNQVAAKKLECSDWAGFFRRLVNYARLVRQLSLDALKVCGATLTIWVCIRNTWHYLWFTIGPSELKCLFLPSLSSQVFCNTLAFWAH